MTEQEKPPIPRVLAVFIQQIGLKLTGEQLHEVMRNTLQASDYPDCPSLSDNERTCCEAILRDKEVGARYDWAVQEAKKSEAALRDKVQRLLSKIEHPEYNLLRRLNQVLDNIEVAMVAARDEVRPITEEFKELLK